MEIIWNNINKFITPIDKHSHFSHTYKTNVKGVYKFEWHAPALCFCKQCETGGGSGLSIAFDSYEVRRKHKTKGFVHTIAFVTKKEADEYYNKSIKRPSMSTVSKPKKRLPVAYCANRDHIEALIREHASKRGILKAGFDISIIEDDF